MGCGKGWWWWWGAGEGSTWHLQAGHALPPGTCQPASQASRSHGELPIGGGGFAGGGAAGQGYKVAAGPLQTYLLTVAAAHVVGSQALVLLVAAVA